MRQIWILGMMLLCSSILLGQGWERTYDTIEGIAELGFEVRQTPDGGYIAVGYDYDYMPFPAYYSLFLLRTDEHGNLLWRKKYGSSFSGDSYSASVKATQDGGYIVVCSKESLGTNFETSLFKTNAIGEVEWEQTIEREYYMFVSYIQICDDSGYILSGSSDSTINQGFLIKTDEGGNIEWEQYYSSSVELSAVEQTPDNGFIAVGATHEATVNGNVIIVKTNSAGIVEWEQTSEELDPYYNRKCIDILNDGSYIVIEGDFFDTRLIKLDTDGNITWEQISDDYGRNACIRVTEDNGFIILGYDKLTKTNNLGNIVWTQDLPIIGASIQQTSDKGYIICGQGSGNEITLIKTDSLGNSITNQIIGNIAFDQSEDCIIDSVEFELQNWMITAQSETQTYYGTTDSVGNYSLTVDTGNYIISIIPPNQYWEACENDIAIAFGNFYDTTSIDFPIQAAINCPLLTIDISTPLLIRCFNNDYYVQYCNKGTLPSDENGYVTIAFDESLSVNSSTLDWSEQDGNTYTFDIGELDIGECGGFLVNVTVDCEAELGQTHCVEAHIYPDSLCLPLNSLWDGSNIEVTANIIADGDSIEFRVQNTGIEMNESSDYIIVEDHIILLTEPFQLEADESIIQTVACNGATYRLETMQTEGHPIGNRPSVAVEGCGTNDEGEFSTGFVIQFPEDDLSPFISIDCQENVGSYDPNDKMAYPKGYAEQHLIEPNTDIEYKIRFQNTGTAPAFHVVIIDTLSHLLDPTSIIPGASSHPYQFELYGSGIVKFTFDDINLPDSTTNEPASHGFVKFRISQKENIPLRSIIENEAAIYFDYNAPIITNTTFHQIGENFVHVLVISDTDFSETENTFLKVYPNPFTESTTFSIEGAVSFEKIQLNIYDVAGKLVEQKVYDRSTFQFDKNNLQNGLYFFELETENGIISTGKIIVD